MILYSPVSLLSKRRRIALGDGVTNRFPAFSFFFCLQKFANFISPVWRSFFSFLFISIAKLVDANSIESSWTKWSVHYYQRALTSSRRRNRFDTCCKSSFAGRWNLLLQQNRPGRIPIGWRRAPGAVRISRLTFSGVRLPRFLSSVRKNKSSRSADTSMLNELIAPQSKGNENKKKTCCIAFTRADRSFY